MNRVLFALFAALCLFATSAQAQFSTGIVATNTSEVSDLVVASKSADTDALYNSNYARASWPDTVLSYQRYGYPFNYGDDNVSLTDPGVLLGAPRMFNYTPAGSQASLHVEGHLDGYALGWGGSVRLGLVDNLLVNSGSGSPELTLAGGTPPSDGNGTSWSVYVQLHPTPATAALLNSTYDVGFTAPQSCEWTDGSTTVTCPDIWTASDGDGWVELKATAVGDFYGNSHSYNLDSSFPGYNAGDLVFDAIEVIDNPADEAATPFTGRIGLNSGEIPFVGSTISLVGVQKAGLVSLASPLTEEADSALDQVCTLIFGIIEQPIGTTAASGSGSPSNGVCTVSLSTSGGATLDATVGGAGSASVDGVCAGSNSCKFKLSGTTKWDDPNDIPRFVMDNQGIGLLGGSGMLMTNTCTGASSPKCQVTFNLESKTVAVGGSVSSKLTALPSN
jgi:hypothetical protein